MVGVRQERGLQIAKDKRVKRIAGPTWLVPSQFGAGGYVVDVDASTCSCPDHETRAVKCKHQWAVEIVRRETVRETETGADGSKTVRETTREVRLTYTQDWPSYNAAQTREKEHVGTLLRALCEGIQTPPKRLGRPRLPLADLVTSATMKVYVGMSGRRASTDIRECEAKGLTTCSPHYNSVHNLIERADITPLLKALVEETAAPLKAIETNFAVDATGFATSTYARWFDHKYGREMKEQTWMKCHAMIGVTTNVITAAEVTGGTVNDCPQLPGLVAATARNFTIAEVSADKGYISNKNFEAIEAVGAVPYVPFKSNNRGEGPAAWRRMWHLFSYRREDFIARYHQRSNAEAAFSAIKRKFGASVRAKLPVAQTNEVYLKCIAYNLSVLVHAMYELGIDPAFNAPSAGVAS